MASAVRTPLLARGCCRSAAIRLEEIGDRSGAQISSGLQPCGMRMYSEESDFFVTCEKPCDSRGRSEQELKVSEQCLGKSRKEDTSEK